MTTRLFIGLMSGTSVDGIDAALVRITGRGGNYRAQVLQHVERKWPKKLRDGLLAVMAPAATTTSAICELNMLVAAEMAHAVENLLVIANVEKKQITAIASHGQTVCHLPPRSRRHGVKLGSTLQLGDVSVIATLTGITTVGNFRPADMAVGGQGAPLVPWTDVVLLADRRKTRCIQNIGGIANVTYLPSGQWSVVNGQKEERCAKSTDHWPLTTDHSVLAFDTGPGNMLLDAAVSLATDGKQKFDRNGRLAAKGALDMKLFRRLQAHHYLTQRPPKSTGREDFGLPFAKRLLADLETRNLKLETLLHTLTRFTAWSIADAYLQFLPTLPDEVIVCGGGADNPVLMAMLREEFDKLISEFVGPKEIFIRRIDEFGIANKSKEAASFAILGAATLDGVPANLPSVTGASRPVILGVVAQP